MAIILLACGPCVVIVNCWDRFCTLGRAPRTKETLPDFREWCRVTRHPRVFHGLTDCQRTPGNGASQKYFEVLNCSETQKVVFATFMLGGKAEHWWRMEKRLLESQEPLEWENFKDVFFKKYFPRSVHRQKESKFIRLRQGNMTVAEYETKFTQLSRFASDLTSTEERKAFRFLDGLSPFFLRMSSPFISWKPIQWW